MSVETYEYDIKDEHLQVLFYPSKMGVLGTAVLEIRSENRLTGEICSRSLSYDELIVMNPLFARKSIVTETLSGIPFLLLKGQSIAVHWDFENDPVKLHIELVSEYVSIDSKIDKSADDYLHMARPAIMFAWRAFIVLLVVIMSSLITKV